MSSIIRSVYSVCPVCLKKIPALLERIDGKTGIYITKTCQEHGYFSVPVWRDRVDFNSWVSREYPLTDDESQHCNGNCRGCNAHTQGTCCVLLEVTSRCNLHCPFCFAEGGRDKSEPSLDELFHCIDDILSLADSPLLQLSGGEPTLRDDLPELVRYAKAKGCSYVQVNTNGLRLAEDKYFLDRLAVSGLDIVFLQFDGVNDEIYRTLRGKSLLDTKLAAIQNCDKYHIGVTLVPTVTAGINDKALGDIVNLAAELSPAVRGIHFQPVAFLGRFPSSEDDTRRFTLDELIEAVCSQTGIQEEAFIPSRCDHALCGFHAAFLRNNSGEFVPLTHRENDTQDRQRTTAEKNRQFIGSHWSRSDNHAVQQSPNTKTFTVSSQLDNMDFDSFVQRIRSSTLTLSAMAFQDAMNLNLERLYRCSLHVYDNGKLLPFCAKYLTPFDIKVKK